MSEFGVSFEKMQQLRAKMEALQVRAEDWEEHFICSSGKGGQNVNKVATCVSLRHIPTGIAVKCQRERSQGLNRFWARWILLGKIEKQRKMAEQARVAQREKQRRRNRKRPAALKEAVLESKRRQSRKKDARRQWRCRLAEE